MVLNAIRELNKAVPFRPHEIRLTSGAAHKVVHPECVAIAPRGSWVMLADENDHPHWIGTILIEEVTHPGGSGRRGKAKRRS